MVLFHRKQSQTATALSPTEAVTDAIRQGIISRAKIANRTGLRPETVDLILDRMERSGRLRREALGAMCGGGGCSSCEHSAAGGGCATATSGGSARGPVSLVLQRRPIE